MKTMNLFMTDFGAVEITETEAAIYRLMCGPDGFVWDRRFDEPRDMFHRHMNARYRAAISRQQLAVGGTLRLVS